jgi:hypothetical protein
LFTHSRELFRQRADWYGPLQVDPRVVLRHTLNEHAHSAFDFVGVEHSVAVCIQAAEEVRRPLRRGLRTSYQDNCRNRGTQSKAFDEIS